MAAKTRVWMIRYGLLALGIVALDPRFTNAQGLLVLTGGPDGIVKVNEQSGASLGTFASFGAQAPFFPQLGLTFGPGGDLYVPGRDAGSGCKVLQFDGRTGAFEGVYASDPNHPCDVIVFGPDGFGYTTSIAVPSIRRFNAPGGPSQQFATLSDAGTIQAAGYMTFGPDGDLYVGTQDKGILRFSGQSGALVSTFVAPGSGGLNLPAGLTFGPDGHLYVVQGAFVHSILRFNGATGAFMDAFVGGANAANNLDIVYGIAWGPDGLLYVTNLDVSTNRSSIVRFERRGGAFKDVFAQVSTGPLALAIAFTPRSSTCPDGSSFDWDGDALLDCWERDGIDADGDGVVDFRLEHDFNGDGTIDAAEKADPRKKDKFVEIDWMEMHRPDPGALQSVVASFANAPVSNPDGTTGIRLHLLIDEQAAPHADGMTFVSPNGDCGERQKVLGVPDFDDLKAASFGTPSERAGAGAAGLLAARRLVYHYSLFVHGLRGASHLSGCAEMPGDDFVVSLPGFISSFGTPTESNGSADYQAATFMHEFGHNLGLHHGGADDVNCKPNYISIMNYPLMYDGAFLVGRRLDYSRQALLTLDVSNLDETLGVGGSAGDRIVFGPVFRGSNGRLQLTGDDVDASGAIDWNDNGIATEKMLGVIGLNNFGSLLGACNGTGGPIFRGHDDWANLDYHFRYSTNFGAAVRQSVPEESITHDELLAGGLDGDGDGVPNLVDNCMAVANPTQSDANGNGVGDRCDPVNSPPTASASPDQIVTATSAAGGSVMLAGSGADPNEDPLTFTWTEGGTVLGVGPQISPTLPIGVHDVQLTVTDGRGGQSTDMTRVTVTYGVCLLYDPAVGKKAGSTYPIKIRLCDSAGGNLSSPGVTLHAREAKRASADQPLLVDDSGNANPDSNFRYDATLDGYVFNLSTKGYLPGTYTLTLTAGSDGVVHIVTFALK